MNITWDANNYTDNFSFVHQYGEGVLSLLDVPTDSFVIDLGCGNGALTAKLAEKGYRVLGIDASAEMLKIAKENHPHLTFAQADATEFSLSELGDLPAKADAIFSNAVFHWIDAERQAQLLQTIANNLKPGGQLVFEFGGKGNAEAVHSTLEKCFQKRGLTYPRVFYFPSIGEYAPLMEKCGLQVEFATLFDRPTVQNTENGLIDWINMFVKKPFEGMDADLKAEILAETKALLQDVLFVDGKWLIDYVRIRMKARKIGH